MPNPLLNVVRFYGRLLFSHHDHRSLFSIILSTIDFKADVCALLKLLWTFWDSIRKIKNQLQMLSICFLRKYKKGFEQFCSNSFINLKRYLTSGRANVNKQRLYGSLFSPRYYVANRNSF